MRAALRNTPDELASWDLIFCKGAGTAHLDERLAYHEQSSIPLTRNKMRCLRDGDWLNDEVINVAMALLQVQVTRRLGRRDACVHVWGGVCTGERMVSFRK